MASQGTYYVDLTRRFGHFPDTIADDLTLNEAREVANKKLNQFTNYYPDAIVNITEELDWPYQVYIEAFFGSSDMRIEVEYDLGDDE